MGLPDLSISIVSFNVKELLRRCIQSIYDSTNGANIEIFVVDNNSSDGSREMVESEFPQVRLIANRSNVGYSKANNQAIALSNAPFVLVLNSDTEVKQHSIHSMLECMKEDKSIGAIGPKLLNPDGSIQPSYNNKFPDVLTAIGETLFFSSIKYALHKDRYFKKYLLNRIHLKHDKKSEVSWTGGACLLVRRGTIDDIGRMDENFFFSCEEMDWCYRMKKSGWKVYYLPDAEVIHHWGKSARIVSDFIFVESHKSRIYYYYKYFKANSLHFVRLLTIAEISIRAAILLVMKLFLPGKREFINGRLRAYFETIRYIIKFNGKKQGF